MKHQIRSKRILIFSGIVAIVVGIFTYLHISKNEITEKDAYTTTRIVGKDKDGNTIYNTEISIEPIRFKDSEGNWTDYDPSLTRSSKEGYDYQLASSNNQAYYKKDLTSDSAILIGKENKLLNYSVGDLIYINSSGETQMVSIPNLKASAVKKDNSVTYKDVYGNGIDLQFTNTNTQVIKELVIHDKNSLPKPTISNAYLQLTVKTSLPRGVDLYITNTEDPTSEKIKWDRKTSKSIPEGVEFRDNNQKVDRNFDGVINSEDTLLYVIPAARALDKSALNELSSLTPNPISQEIMLFSISQEKTTNLSVMTPYTWIEKAEFPVKIDPSITFQPQTSIDDGAWYEGNSTLVTNLFNNLMGGYTNGTTGRVNSYTRFSNVTIPQYATITSASFEVKARLSNSANTVNARIIGVDEDSPNAPANYSDAENATRTTAYVDWNAIPAWTSNAIYTTPDFSSVIQEIVNRPGWGPGNSMIIYTEDNGTTATNDTHRTAYAYDLGAADSMKLNVTYTTLPRPYHSSLYLQFNEATGQVTNDSSNYQNSGTLGANSSAASDDPTWQQPQNCIAHTCLLFDGSNDYVNIPDSDSLEPDSIMIGAWIKPSNVSGTKNIVSKYGDTSYNDSYKLALSGNKVKFDVNLTGTGWVSVTGNISLSASTWYYVTGTYDGTNLRVYVNAVLDNSTTTTGPIFKSNASVKVGKPGNLVPGEMYTGYIDEVKIYDSAKTIEQIRSEYNARNSLTGLAGSVGNSTPPLTFNPIGYWNFEEASGTTVNDRSTNGRTGTVTGTGTWTTGKVGKAMNFDGSSGYVSVADTSDLRLTSSWTVSAWVKPDALKDYGNIFMKTTNQTNGYGLITLANGSWNWQQYSNSSWNDTVGGTAGSLVNNTWSFLTITYDGTTLRTYQNGTLTNSASKTTITSGTAALTIGADTFNGRYFDGDIDEVRIYNYARSQAQITEDLNGNHPIGGSPIGSQVIRYKFEEGGGTTAYNSVLSNQSLTAVVNSTTYTPNGRYGKGVLMNGTSSQIYRNNTTEIDLNENLSSGFTASIWVNPASDGENDIGRIFQKGTNTYMRTTNESGGFVDLEASFDLSSTDATISLPGILPLNTWSHIAMVYSGSTQIQIYINGRLRATSTNGVGSIPSDSGTMFIGAGASGTPAFDGVLDEFKLYSTALTQAQIAIDYNGNNALLIGNLGTTSTLQPNDSFSRGVFCNPGSALSNCNPVGYWNFEEASGTYYDSSGTGNNGTLGGSGGARGNGKIGKGIVLNGSGYVQISDNSSIDITNSISFSAWINTTLSGTSQHIISKSGAYEFRTHTDDSIRVRIGNLSDNFSGSTDPISLNTWYHVVGTYDGSRYAVYINGVLQSSSTDATSGTIGTNNNNLFVGAITTAASGKFEGKIDEPMIFDYSISPEQIAWYYNKGKPYIHLKLDECTGSTIQDSSGNGKAGSITIGGSGSQTSIGDCTSSGTARYNGISGKYNYSVNLDGTNDYMSVTSPNLPTENFSYSTWVYPTATSGTMNILSASDGSGGDEILVRSNSGGTVTIRVNGASDDLVSGQTLTAGAWNHILVTRNGSDIYLYINGKKDANTGSDGSALSFSSCALLIGVDAGSSCTSTFGGYFDGKIDDVKVFHYALTDVQARTLYNNGTIYWGPAQGAP